ncbi:hypothetical protein PMAYCL1PPCAC_00358, partial [Pristionchus mayeri]
VMYPLIILRRALKAAKRMYDMMPKTQPGDKSGEFDHAKSEAGEIFGSHAKCAAATDDEKVRANYEEISGFWLKSMGLFPYG